MQVLHVDRARMRLPLAFLALAIVAAAPAGAQNRQDNAFSWSGTIPNGRRILVKNINGAVQVERSTSNRVEVTGTKEWRRGSPDDVRIEQKKLDNGDVVICAMWHPESRCEESGINTPRGTQWNRNSNNDVSVRFVVRVPEGVRVDLNSVNGGVEVDGVTTEIVARTVNGSIRARSAGGPVRASTVNGSIDVAMGSLGSANDLQYSTVNGSITITLPTNFGAQLELSTVNGRVHTDFPITVSGTLSPRNLRGTVGDGATRMKASTVNGSVTLRKGS
jgi:hypothetical protein